jgi:hypothetical protein
MKFGMVSTEVPGFPLTRGKKIGSNVGYYWRNLPINSEMWVFQGLSMLNLKYPNL